MCPQPGAQADVPTLQYLEVLFGRFVNILLGFAGVLLFLTFIIGGFRYITSGGDQKAIAAAHATLTYAVLGLILVILAYSFLALIEYITGADISTFYIVQC